MTADGSVSRVLQVHTRYRLAGGEDEVVEAERRLLAEAGVEVSQVIFDNADLRESRSLVGDLRLAASAIWSRAAEHRVKAAVAAGSPQVMHVHNTFPTASPSVYAAAAELGVPVVQTLHNYRFVCPAATLFRDGRVCTDCVGRSVPWPAVLHACVRGSHAQSAVAATTMAIHRARGTFSRDIAAYLALTTFQRQMMIDGGFPAKRIQILPNFLEPDPGVGSDRRSGVLFVGRLSREKGVATLLAAASMLPGVVRVIGDGPLASEVQAADARGDVDYLGSLTKDAVMDLVRRATAVVVPSVWFEGLPLVVLEAFATGTPVIASRIGSLAELIDKGVTGLLAEPNNPENLTERIRWAIDHPGEMRAMGAKARLGYEARYRGAHHLVGLLQAYSTVRPARARGPEKPDA